MRIAVYCGSSFGASAVYADAAAELGRELARRGHELVYGGGRVGLMGVVADAVVGAGGAATGVITEHLVAAEVAHDGLTRLEVVGSMHERKARMVALAAAVIVLPGGFGTFDETFEVLTWNQLGLVRSPVVLVDVGGFFQPFQALVAAAAGAGFVRPEHVDLVRVAATPAAAVDLAEQPSAAAVPKWVDRRD